MISFSFSNSIAMRCSAGRFIWRFMLPRSEVAPRIDWAICSLLRTVWMRRETACSWVRIWWNFWMYLGLGPGCQPLPFIYEPIWYGAGLRSIVVYGVGRNGIDICLPPRPHQVLCLDLAGPHLSILGALLDVLHQLLLLILKLDSFPI